MLQNEEMEEMEETLDRMYEEEEQNPTVFLHGKRYIGTSAWDAGAHIHILLNTIQPRTIFRHSWKHVVEYLYYYSLMKKRTTLPQILQLIILSDDTFAVCDKTIWLRLVQRRWKRAVQQRRAFVQSYSVVGRELGQLRLRHVPQLRGLMTAYTSTRTDSHLRSSRREYSASLNLWPDLDNGPSL
jgi:hypothetical protein